MEVTDEAHLLCQEIQRISGGGNSVTWGDLFKDEEVEQKFEALLGTLKSARKKGLLDFKGDLLLAGTHDNVVITVTSIPDKEPAAAEAPAEAAPAATNGEAAAPVATGSAPAAAGVAPEDPKAAPVPEVPLPAEPLAAKPPAAEQEPEERAVAEAPAEAGDAEATQTAFDDEASGPPTGSAGKEKMVKDKDGKWVVNTSYIDWRTKDPNLLEARRDTDTSVPVTGAVVGTATKTGQLDQDGKWQQVDVSYINHRTKVVDNLDGRKRSDTGANDNVGSATVKKARDGKWQVDTSYVGFRTGDTNNLDRKFEKRFVPDYADPAEKKYSHAELKLQTGDRPADVDPSRKELYLSAEEFQVVFGTSAADFQGMPKWKQQNMKKAKELF